MDTQFFEPFCQLKNYKVHNYTIFQGLNSNSSSEEYLVSTFDKIMKKIIRPIFVRF